MYYALPKPATLLSKRAAFINFSPELLPRRCAHVSTRPGRLQTRSHTSGPVNTCVMIISCLSKCVYIYIYIHISQNDFKYECVAITHNLREQEQRAPLQLKQKNIVCHAQNSSRAALSACVHHY